MLLAKTLEICQSLLQTHASVPLFYTEARLILILVVKFTLTVDH